MGKEVGQFRFFAGAEQGQPVEHAANRGPSCRQGGSLTRPAGDLQSRIAKTLDEAEAGPRRIQTAGKPEQRQGAEFAVDDARGF